MGVRDLTTLALKTVLVVNTNVSVPASQQVADRYCAMYGIPVANQFKRDMGSSVNWAYSAGRYASFWDALNTHRLAIGAHSILSTAGCPVKIELVTSDNMDSAYINFAHLLGLTPRIAALGYEPKGDGGFPCDSAGTHIVEHHGAEHKGRQTLWESAGVAAALNTAPDSEHTAVGGGTTLPYWFTTYRPDWNGDYSIMTNLLTGHVGYYTAEEATHPATLWDLSRVILGKTGNLQKSIPQQPTALVLAVISWIGANAGYGHTSKQALVAKRMQNAGLALRYWYMTDQTVNPGSPTDLLLPVSGSEPWTVAGLNGAGYTDCVYTYGVGLGFENSSYDNWNTTMVPRPEGGVFCGSASNGAYWGQYVHVTAGFSYLAHMRENTGGYHQGELEQSKVCDIWLNLLAGRTMAEAAWTGLEYSFLAVGDPLARPFQVQQPAYTFVPDTAPAQFFFEDKTSVAPGIPQTSAQILVASINTPAAISVVNGEYQIESGEWTSLTGTVANGQRVRVRHTSSSSSNTPVHTTLTIGGVSDTFTSTTVLVDTTPSPFDFGSAPSATPSQLQTSGQVSINGTNAPAPFTFSGPGEWQTGDYSSGSLVMGAWSSALTGTCPPAPAEMRVRHYAAAGNSQTVVSTVTFPSGPVSGSFTSTTVAASGFSITSAILSSGVFTITGSDFGTKPTPIAPLVFKPLVGFADGLDIEDASTGYAAVQYTDSPTPPTRPKPAIYNADGIGGAAVRTQGRSYTASETQDVVNHVGVILSGTHKELIVNIWHKLTVTAGTPNSVLVKYMRGGMLNPADATSLEAGYHYRPKMGGMYYMNSSGTYDTSDASNFRLYVYSSSGTDEWNVDMNQGSAPYPVPTTAWGQWWNDESHFKFNDYGSSNGFARLTVNNKLAVVQTNINPVQDAGTIGFQFITPTPDISSGSGLGADFDIYHSRLYIDTTEARVFLGNASTIGACTGRFMLGPTAWATGSITAEAACFSNTVPATWDWVYVVKSDGTISAGYRWRGP